MPAIIFLRIALKIMLIVYLRRRYIRDASNRESVTGFSVCLPGEAAFRVGHLEVIFWT